MSAKPLEDWILRGGGLQCGDCKHSYQPAVGMATRRYTCGCPHPHGSIDAATIEERVVADAQEATITDAHRYVRKHSGATLDEDDASELREYWATLGPTHRRDLVNFILGKAILTNNGRHILYIWGPPADPEDHQL